MFGITPEAQQVEKVSRSFEIFKRQNSTSEYSRYGGIPRETGALAREFRVPLLKLDDGHASIYKEDDSNEEDGNSDSDSDSDDNEKVTFKKGDRVTYGGKTISIEEVNNRTLSSGQRGEVYEVEGDRVAVVFNICGLETKKADKDEKHTETCGQALVTWLDVKDVKQDLHAKTHDCFIALEALYEVLESRQPMIVYYPYYGFGQSKSKYTREKFLKTEKRIFNQMPEGVVMICAQNSWEAGPEVKDKFPEALKEYIKSLQVPKENQVPKMFKIFTNSVCIEPPKDQNLLNAFIKQIEEDRLTEISEGNLSTLHKVLKDNNLSCINLEHANVQDMILTRKKVKKIVAWATNHYLSSCPLPCVKDGNLHIPLESIKHAILRFKEKPKKQTKSIEDLATDEYEEKLVSEVVRSEDIGVKFDDVGALENVKKVLYETVILPMRRPELFSHGNLLRPCKGILLFGPPGTGKTLLAKALATESGANFINITAATITSMWAGESEHLTRALFSYASKLAPVIIFVDEVDSLLGARGHSNHDTSRLNEFMSAWDGLKSKESQRILVIGATNRPFDLDEAVIRRMPRRIYVGLPDVKNRSKIVKVLLEKENLEPGFSFKQLAKATEGYSGSDLKNLCVAAAYRPIEDFLKQENKGEGSNGVPALRPLNLNDFINAKAKVRPSVSRNAQSIIKLIEWNEQYGEGGQNRT